MKAKRLLLLTDVEGVLDKNGQLIKSLTTAEAQALIEDGTISGGMIPKIESCIDVIAEGVEGVVIINGRVPHAVLLELFTEHGAGTLIERRRPRGSATGSMMSERAGTHNGFDHVEAWVFDLDNTLYPADCNLFAQIDRRMGEFIAEQLRHSARGGAGAAPDLLLRARHDARRAGAAATASRPMRFSIMCMTSISRPSRPSPELGGALDALPGRKFIFTNGSRKHAEAVAARLGVLGRFEDILRHPRARIHPPQADCAKPMSASRGRMRRRPGPGRDVRRPAA